MHSQIKNQGFLTLNMMPGNLVQMQTVIQQVTLGPGICIFQKSSQVLLMLLVLRPQGSVIQEVPSGSDDLMSSFPTFQGLTVKPYSHDGPLGFSTPPNLPSEVGDARVSSEALHHSGTDTWAERLSLHLSHGRDQARAKGRLGQHSFSGCCNNILPPVGFNNRNLLCTVLQMRSPKSGIGRAGSFRGL